MPSMLRKRRRRVIQDVNDEDAENIPILTEAQREAINNDLPANGELRKIFGELQDQISQFRDERRELKAELATRKKQRTRSMRVSKKSEEDFGVGDTARFFAINIWAFAPNLTWMGEDIETMPDDDPALPSHLVPRKKFIQDYIDALPPTVRESYADIDIRSIFTTDMGSIRSTKVYDVKQAAFRIFEAPVADYVTASRTPGIQMDPPAQVQELLGFQPRNPNDPKSKDTYSTKPPLIFGAGEGPQTERLFRVEMLAKALRVILFGPSSVNGTAVANNDTYGKMWAITRVTPPLIAFATVVVNYLLSPDREFTPTGKYSKMEYGERYARYRSWATGLATYEAGRETIKFWERIVLAGFTADNGDAAEEGTDDGDILTQIQAAAAAEAESNRPNVPGVEPATAEQ